MILKLIWSGVIAAVFSSLAAGAVDCRKPCGPEEVFSCVGQAKAPRLTAKEVYDDLIFSSTKSADGFCRSCSVGKANGLQRDYCTKFCQTEQGTYFSYDHFMAAYAAVKAKEPDFFSISCSGTADERKQELASFLATAAQETTSGISYTSDGAYFRYEVDSLQTADGKPCENFDCKTAYYADASLMVVAGDASGNTYTKYYIDNGTINGDGTVSGNKVMLDGPGAVTRAWAESAPPPAGYTWKKLTDAVQPGYWVGMGALQLTGGSMMGFFGWYQNHLADPRQDSANLQNFIDRFLVDGQLGFEGAFWYWNYRINGTGYPTIHQVLASDGAVCHEIAIVTRMVNGGCNHSEYRKRYFDYFLGGNVFATGSKATCVNTAGIMVNCTDSSAVLNSLFCTFGDDPRGQKLQDYCYDHIPPR